MSVINGGALSLVDNTVLDTSNIASPDTVSTILKSGTGQVYFDADDNTIVLTCSASAQAQLQINSIDVTQVAVEIEYEGTPAPTTDFRLVEVRRNPGTETFAAKITRTSGNKVKYENAANAGTTGALALPTAAGWRLFVGLEKGTTTSNGKIRCLIYTENDGKGTTIAETVVNTDAGNTQTNNFVKLWVGYQSGGPGTQKIRNIQWTFGQYTPLGALVWMGVATTGAYVKQDYTNKAPVGAVLTANVISGTLPGAVEIVGQVALVPRPTAAAATVEFTLTLNGNSVSEQVTYQPTPATGGGISRWVKMADTGNVSDWQ